MFSYKVVIKLHDTDAAGRLFFSNQFKLLHDAYESLMSKLGFPFVDLLRKEKFFLPIVHAESDYTRPLFVGDRVTITVSIGKIGRTSFSLEYKLLDDKKRIVGAGQTVHVAVDKITHRKILLPQKLRAILTKAS